MKLLRSRKTSSRRRIVRRAGSICQAEEIIWVITALGTFGFGMEYAPFVNLNQLGAIILKGVTLEPRLQVINRPELWEYRQGCCTPLACRTRAQSA